MNTAPYNPALARARGQGLERFRVYADTQATVDAHWYEIDPLGHLRFFENDHCGRNQPLEIKSYAPGVWKEVTCLGDALEMDERIKTWLDPMAEQMEHG